MADKRGGQRPEAGRVVINGRFLTQPLTGVQRYAIEIVRQIDATLDRHRGAVQVELLTPPGAPVMPWRHIRQKECGRATGHLWEQRDLPSHAGNSPLLCLCNFAPVLSGNVALVLHDIQPLRFPAAYSVGYRTWVRIAIPLMARRARRLITVSEFSRREIGDRLGIDADRIGVVPNSAEHITGVEADPRILDRLSVRPGRYFFALGSLAEHKNTSLLAEIAPRLAHPVVIAGDRNPRVLGDAALAPGGNPAAIFAGRVTDAEARCLYENAAAFLFPSRYEGFGIPPLEAMTLGCPVISADAAALPETLGDAALYCPADDREMWIRSANALAADPARREALAAAGRGRAAQFDWRGSAEMLWRELGVLGVAMPS